MTPPRIPYPLLEPHARATAALLARAGGDPSELRSDPHSALVDVLADLIIWAECTGGDFYAAFKTAVMHAEDEIGEAYR